MADLNHLQVPLPSAAQDDEQFKLLQDWLGSYKVEEFLDTTVDSKQSSAHDASQRASSLIKEEVCLEIVWLAFALTKYYVLPRPYQGIADHTEKRRDPNGYDPRKPSLSTAGGNLAHVQPTARNLTRDIPP